MAGYAESQAVFGFVCKIQNRFQRATSSEIRVNCSLTPELAALRDVHADFLYRSGTQHLSARQRDCPENAKDEDRSAMEGRDEIRAAAMAMASKAKARATRTRDSFRGDTRNGAQAKGVTMNSVYCRQGSRRRIAAEAEFHWP